MANRVSEISAFVQPLFQLNLGWCATRFNQKNTAEVMLANSSLVTLKDPTTPLPPVLWENQPSDKKSGYRVEEPGLWDHMG